MSERQYQWTNVTLQGAFARRDGAGALVFKDKMWLLGGWHPRDPVNFPRICNNEVWSSEDGEVWLLEKPNTFIDGYFDPKADWEGRHTAGYAVFKDKMWIVGGDGNQGYYQNDVWSSSDGITWTLVHDNVPWGPRALHYTVVFDDKLWIIGGQTIPQFAPGEEQFYHDAWCSPDGVHWEEVPLDEPVWPQRGMIGGNVVFNNRIWILGGGRYDTPNIPDRTFFNDVWSSLDGSHWEQHLPQAPWAPRQYHDVAVFDGCMWVLEGYSGENRNDVWYSPDGTTWHEVPGTPWLPRHAASVFVYKNALWMVAGGHMTSDVWKLERVN